MNLNKAQILGRITQDLELKTTPNGNQVLSFSIATNRTWKDQDGQKQEKTDFHNIVVWGKQAQTLAQYAVKGQELYVEGRLETRMWEDAEKKKNYRTEVILEQFSFGAKPGENKGTPSNIPSDAAPINITSDLDIIPDEDLPF